MLLETDFSPVLKKEDGWDEGDAESPDSTETEDGSNTDLDLEETE